MIDINELRQSLGAIRPEEVAELLDRLEAAEKERDFAKAEIARLHDDIRELTDVRVLDEKLGSELNAVAKERDALQAKIARMEQQVPVAEWIENRFHKYPQLVWNEKYRVGIGDKLYALPGAKGE